MKDEDLCVFLTELFREPQYSNYIEPVDETEAVGNSMWYMPYFVTFSAKKRIADDGRADLNGVCKNDFIETRPDLLNSSAEILANFD